MLTTTTPQQTRTQAGPRRCAVRLALACTVALGWVAVLAPGPAQAAIETAADTGGGAAHDTDSGTSQTAGLVRADVTPTRVAGLFGVHVDGGWLLR
jgi:hypothetical protein